MYMRVILGSDHRGFFLKENIKQWLLAEGYQVIDVGATSLVPDDDYVDFANAAVKEVSSNDDRILLFCRNGFGMMIASNRFVGVRCGLAFDDKAVLKGRTDDDINCLSIPTDYVKEVSVKKMIKTFLTQTFSSTENYRRRISKLDRLFK